jgi:hypothetical protein
MEKSKGGKTALARQHKTTINMKFFLLLKVYLYRD